MDYGFRIPGTERPDIVIRRSEWTGVSVRIDGVKLKPTGRPRAWTIPLGAGTVKTLRVTGQFTGMRVLVDGAEIPLEPALSRWMTVLMLLPIVLAIGGLIGGTIGIVGIIVNRAVATSRLGATVKAVAMVVVTAAGAGLWLASALVISPPVALPKLQVGQCLNDVHEDSTIATAMTGVVDCATPHDSEVVGVALMDNQPGFSSDGLIRMAADGYCPLAFADYVGIDAKASNLRMFAIVPTETSWTKEGDRAITCIVASGDGSKLTGTVEGTKR